MDDTFEPLIKAKNKEEMTFDKWVTKNKLKSQPDRKLLQEEKTVPMISNEELEKIKSDAYQQGVNQAQDEINQAKKELSQLTELVLEPLRLVDEDVQNEILTLTTWLCKTCLDIELSVNPKKLMAMMNEIKEILPSARNVKTLFLNPNDAQILKGALASVDMEIKPEHIISDDSLTRGEYRLETETRELDGRLELRIRELIENAFNTGESND